MVSSSLSQSVGADGQPRVEGIENSPLFLPSAFPDHVRSLPELKRACDTEKRLRLAQADDARIEIRKQRRIIQGLWQFKRLNVSGTGNRPNTRMLTLYNRINYKVERAAYKYRTARAALLSLNPDAPWKERFKELRKADIRGPGRDPDDTKTTNGWFEPSCIWLVARTRNSRQTDEEFDEVLRVEWAKICARSIHWQEEY